MKRATSILFIILLFGLTSCSDDKNSKNTATPSNPAPPPNNGNNGDPLISGRCIAAGVDDLGNNNNKDYERIFAKARGDVQGGFVWDSTLMAQPDRLTSERRFYIRVIARPAPASQSVADDGQICQYQSTYTKLKLDINLRASNQPQGQKYTTITIPSVTVDNGDNSQCSAIYDLSIQPEWTTPDYWVLDVHNVMWDRCNNGYDNPSCDFAGHGPYNNFYVFSGACFEIEIQVVTDNTKNFQELVN